MGSLLSRFMFFLALFLASAGYTADVSNACSGYLNGSTTSLRQDLKGKGYAFLTPPAFLNDQQMQSYFMSLPKGWQLTFDGKRVDFYAKAKENWYQTNLSQFGTKQQDFINLIFDPIASYVDWVVDQIQQALPDEKVMMDYVDIRTSTKYQNTSSEGVEQFHPDGGHLSVSMPLVGQGTIVLNDENISEQTEKGRMLVFSGYDRGVTKPTLHRKPKGQEDRLLLLIRLKKEVSN